MCHARVTVDGSRPGFLPRGTAGTLLGFCYCFGRRACAGELARRLLSHPPRNVGFMVVLREFLYRRDDLVAQFLEQLEGGEYDEERIKEQSGRTSVGGGSAGVGSLSLSAERRREGASETELTMRQTAASRFNRLYSLLDLGGGIQPLNSLDDDIWDQLLSNEVVEVEAVLTLLSGVVEMSQAASMASLLPLIETIQSLPDDWLPESIDRDEVEKISGQIPIVQDFAEHLATGPVPCTFVPAGAPRYKFFAELRRDGIRGELTDLEGEVTVLARLTRKVAKGRPETVGQPVPGMQLNREQRRKGGKSAALTVRLQHPSAVVSAIAIYR